MEKCRQRLSNPPAEDRSPSRRTVICKWSSAVHSTSALSLYKAIYIFAGLSSVHSQKEEERDKTAVRQGVEISRGELWGENSGLPVWSDVEGEVCNFCAISSTQQNFPPSAFNRSNYWFWAVSDCFGCSNKQSNVFKDTSSVNTLRKYLNLRKYTNHLYIVIKTIKCYSSDINNTQKTRLLSPLHAF